MGGLVTGYHKSYGKELDKPDDLEAFIHFRVTNTTLKSVSFDRRRIDEMRYGEEIELIIRLLKDAQVVQILARSTK